MQYCLMFLATLVFPCSTHTLSDVRCFKYQFTTKCYLDHVNVEHDWQQKVSMGKCDMCHSAVEVYTSVWLLGALIMTSCCSWSISSNPSSSLVNSPVSLSLPTPRTAFLVWACHYFLLVDGLGQTSDHYHHYQNDDSKDDKDEMVVERKAETISEWDRVDTASKHWSNSSVNKEKDFKNITMNIKLTVFNPVTCH